MKLDFDESAADMIARFKKSRSRDFKEMLEALEFHPVTLSADVRYDSFYDDWDIIDSLLFRIYVISRGFTMSDVNRAKATITVSSDSLTKAVEILKYKDQGDSNVC